MTGMAKRYAVGNFPSEFRVSSKAVNVMDFEVFLTMAKAAVIAVAPENRFSPLHTFRVHTLVLPAFPSVVVFSLVVLIPALTRAEVKVANVLFYF